MLYIHWRDFMTRRLVHAWLDSHAHFMMQLGRGGPSSVDNPDQRIQEDVHLFVNGAIELGHGLMHTVGHLIIFVPMLLFLAPTKMFGTIYCPGWLLYCAVLYSLVGSLITHLIGRWKIPISFQQQRYEADFRHNAVRVRDNAESITLYRSEPNEAASMLRQFERIKITVWLDMLYTKRLEFFTRGYSYVQFLVPFFILAPSFFTNSITLGDLFQLTS